MIDRKRCLPSGRWLDRGFMSLSVLCAWLPLVVMAGFFLQLLVSSLPVWREFGLSFIWSTEWDPVANHYGAFNALAGTVVTTVIALGIAIPFAFVTAFYLVDARPGIAAVLSQAIDLLAAIPSIIFGMWGLFILVPIMQNYVMQFLVETLGLGQLPFVGEYYNGFGFLTAGLILALMILPYICAVMRDVFKMVPNVLRESAYGIGCTKWETACDIVMRYGARGLLGGIFIGLGRALGETMAVLFVIGNIQQMPDSLFSCGTTIAATLANNFAEADGMMRAALFGMGLLLLLLSLAVQIGAQYYLVALGRKMGKR